jgi:hypothetical protein
MRGAQLGVPPLKKEEIKKVLSHKAKNDFDAKALDFWTFSFMSNGMNFRDIALLKHQNIVGDFIEFRRSKTQRILKNNSLPILVPVSDMIDKIIKIKKGKFTDTLTASPNIY